MGKKHKGESFGGVEAAADEAMKQVLAEDTLRLSLRAHGIIIDRKTV